MREMMKCSIKKNRQSSHYIFPLKIYFSVLANAKHFVTIIGYYQPVRGILPSIDLHPHLDSWINVIKLTGVMQNPYVVANAHALREIMVLAWRFDFVSCENRAHYYATISYE